MIQKVFMPKLGQTMEEGTIEKWIKKEGDKVDRGDVLLEITTDKATLEVEAYVSGVLKKIIAEEGQVAPINDVIAVVGDPDEEIPDDLLAPAEEAKEEAPQAAAKEEATPAPSKLEEEAVVKAAAPETPAPELGPEAKQASPRRIFASPRARKRAREQKISLSLLTGSGPNGRIVEKDVIKHARKFEQLKVTPAARAIAYEQAIDLTKIKGTGPGGRITKEDLIAAPPIPAVAPADAAPTAAPIEIPGAKREEISAMRKIVAERMSQSKREIPHYYLTMEIDMTDAVAYRSELNSKGDVKISFNDMIIKACGTALKEHPEVNSVWGGDVILSRDEVNVGLAVALEQGLIVPVVKNVDEKSLVGVAKETQALIDKARNKRLTPDEYQGGCLTISNLGMFEIDSFTPVINPGESVILGIGRIAKKPVVRDGGIHIRAMMNVTMSGDHRVVDGAAGAQFLKTVKDLLENAASVT